MDDLDKGECLQEVEGGDSLATSFIASVEECISERECLLYDEGRDRYDILKYLHAVSGARSRLLFK